MGTVSTSTVETADFGATVRRFVRAYGRRVAAEDSYELVGLVNLHDEVDEAIAVAVAGLRSGEGRYSWGEIGMALGTSRQAARQRFGRYCS